MIHELKTWPEFFNQVKEGRKNFEVRRDDRDYKVADILKLKEYDPVSEKYSGDVEVRVVGYILRGPAFGIEDGYCVMSLV